MTTNFVHQMRLLWKPRPDNSVRNIYIGKNRFSNTYKLIAFLLFSLLCLSFSIRATTPSIVGKWYGLKDGSPITVVFNEDKTMSIDAESYSSLTFSGSYKTDVSVNPLEVDLTLPGGMICAAVVNFSGDSEMEFYGVFGAPVYTKRPTSIDKNPKRPEALYLKLSRNPKAFVQKSVVVPNPKAAKLAFERNKRLGKGINLNGLFDNNSGPLHLNPTSDQPIKPEHIKMIADAGFNSVRLDVTWSVHASKTAPYTIEPAFFEKVDNVVKICLKNKLAVSIDLHYYPYINMHEGDSTVNFDDNIKRFYSLWEQIAKHYKNYPPEVYFDILNEPNMEMGAQLWNELIAKSVKLIRKTNPYRTLIIGTPNLGQHWTLGLLDLPKDDWNLIIQIHYYLPHFFTHQGLGYAQAAGSEGTKWFGTPEEKSPIVSDFNFCAKWSKANYRPINIGEFGVVEKADMDSQRRYLTFIRELTDKHGFSFHIWGFREIFRIFDEDKGQWHQPVLEALIPQK